MRSLLNRCAAVVALMVVVCVTTPARAGVDLLIAVSNPSAFTSDQLDALNDAIDYTEDLWESVLTGYQPGIDVPFVPISIQTFSTGLADGGPTTFSQQNGVYVTTAGRVRINPAQMDAITNWEGTGLNVLDELIAHEVAHVLGFGTLWTVNGIYETGSFEYTAEYGLAAYREEFDPDADFIPVESAGGTGSANSHWDQLFRSSEEEGNPDDPFSLTPFVGITDDQGRDLGMELMTAALDPDYGAPFLSNTTIQSFRDIGYTVVPEPASAAMALIGIVWLGRRRAR